ncbi:hypothetical protein P7C70_g3844, partial [Phenoliferia sp. Uapishka_3]
MFILRTLLATSAVAFVAAHHPEGAMEVHRNMGRQSIPIIPGILSLNPNILNGGGQVINLNVVAGLLENQVVGLATSVNILGLLTVNVCACLAVDANGTVKVRDFQTQNTNLTLRSWTHRTATLTTFAPPAQLTPRALAARQTASAIVDALATRDTTPTR